MLTYYELQSEVAKVVQRAADEDYLAKIGTWLNMSQTFLANACDYFIELHGIYNFSSVDGTEEYYLPNDFDKPFRLYDLTNHKKIPIRLEEVYFDANQEAIADATEDVPEEARIYGTRGIRKSIASAGSVIKVKSSSASDTSVAVLVEGYIDSSKTLLDFETITVTGTTAVSGAKTFYDVTRMSKGADSVGYITVQDASDNTLAILTTIDRVLYHKVLRLGLIPDDAYSYRLLYKRKVRRMVNNNDYPFIDADDFFIMDAVAYSYMQEKEMPQYGIPAWQKAKEMMLNIMQNVQGQFGPEHQNKLISSFAEAHRL